MGSVDNFLCACTESNGLERPRYFPRQLLTADDMRAEQDYFREKQRRHNRLLHGWGVVCGLEVVPDAEAGPLAVSICPGYALGPFGDEIYVPEPAKLDLTYCARPPAEPCKPKNAVPPPADGASILVMIQYAECKTRPMRTLPAGCGCDETACEYSRIRDGFEIRCALAPPPPSKVPPAPLSICVIEQKMKSVLPKCLPCESEPWVVLATVTLEKKPTGGGGVLGPGAIDNSTRRIVYSSAAIQEQLINSCCL